MKWGLGEGERGFSSHGSKWKKSKRERGKEIAVEEM